MSMYWSHTLPTVTSPFSASCICSKYIRHISIGWSIVFCIRPNTSAKYLCQHSMSTSFFTDKGALWEQSARSFKSVIHTPVFSWQSSCSRIHHYWTSLGCYWILIHPTPRHLLDVIRSARGFLCFQRFLFLYRPQFSLEIQIILIRQIKHLTYFLYADMVLLRTALN